MTRCSTELAISNVLLATDFSVESAQAVDYARRFCSQQHAKLFVVHVMDVFPYALSADRAARTRIVEIREKAEAQMKEFVRANDLEQTKIEPHLIDGETSAALEKFIREHDIDLIVLGSRGDAGINRIFEGSMAEELFRTAECPVMVVGPKANLHSNAAMFSRLLFATDLSRFSRAALPYVECLLKQTPTAKVTFAHFIARQDGNVYDDNVYERHELRRRLEQQLTEMIDPELRGQIEDVVVEPGTPAEGILKISEGMAADLLVLGVRSGGAFTRAATHGFRSTATRVISEISCPVFIVRSS